MWATYYRRPKKERNWPLILFIIATLVFLGVRGVIKIDLEAIAQIESSNNPKAFNRRTRARGLFQITPVCLQDYNQREGRKSGIITAKELDDPEKNRKIADWYFHTRIPQMLDYYEMNTSDFKLVLACYNWGIGYVRKSGGRMLPKETRDYISKYERLTASR